MADQKISQLTSATTPLAGTEVLPVVQSGATKQVSVADLTAGRAIAVAGVTVTGASAATSVTLANSSGGTNVTMAVTENTGLTVNINEGATARQLILQQGGAETWRLNASGNWAPASGKGINFTANTPASGMTSQLLNWYEEGTWTPSPTGLTVVGTPTYEGRFTRIGRMVYGTLNVSSTTSTASTAGTTYFSGLPFTPNRSSTCQAVSLNTLASFGVGAIAVGLTRVYTPTWAANSNVTVSFSYEV